jgi:hypothetical protein
MSEKTETTSGWPDPARPPSLPTPEAAADEAAQRIMAAVREGRANG